MSQPDPAEQRQKFAERLAEAGVSTKRIIDVHDGAKGTTDHDQMEPSDPSLSGNYGVYGGLGADTDIIEDPDPNTDGGHYTGSPDDIDEWWLIDVDVDDYEDADSGAVSTEGLDSLPDTFTIESPHTDGENGGHRYYAVQGHVAAAIFERYGKKNLKPEWGEIRVYNQYCVGPGSQISPGSCDVSWCDNCNGCDKEWCDRCDDPDGGYYRIADDREIATLGLFSFMQAVGKDIDTGGSGSSNSKPQGSGSTIVTQGDIGEYEADPDADAKAVVRRNQWMQQYLAGLETNPDRSKKDFAMCRSFIEAGVPESDARELLEDSGASKVGASDASKGYWSSTWNRAHLSHEQEQANADDDDGDDGDDGDGDDEIPKPLDFDVYNGGYGYWKQTENDGEMWVDWTNFEIEVDAFLTLEDGSEEIEITVHPQQGDEYSVVVEPTTFNEKRAFKKEVACGRSTTFTGGEGGLAKIKQFVGTQDTDELRGVRQMGRNGDELVLPDGSFTEDGWDDDPDNRYIEQSVGLERKVQISRENTTDADDAEESAAYITEHLPLTRDTERFLPALGWFCAAPLRPVLFEAADLGEFPVLSITGGTGAGKTSTLELLWELFGVGGDPFSANDTSFTTLKTLSSTDTLPVWFDEYKPSDMSPHRLDGFHDYVRKSTRGGVASRGNPDQTTTEYHLKAPVVVSGEQRFAGPAEQRRSILTTFRETTTDPDGEYAHEFTRISGGSYRLESGEIEHYEGADLTAHAVAYHRWLLGFDDDEITEAWRSAESRVLSLLDDYGLGNVDSAGRTALQTIAFGLGMYRAFADHMGTETPIDQDDTDRALTYVAKQQGNDGRRESHLDEFVRFLSLAAMDNQIEEDRHYTRTKNQSTGEWDIRVNMAKSYPKVAQYVQNHGLAEQAELLGESDYRERIKEQSEADTDDTYISCYTQNTRPVGRAFGISVPRASKAVEAFDDDHFYGREEQGENGRYPSDDPHEEHWRNEQ